jgi:hypothetical protein
METTNEEILTPDANESDEEARPLANEDKELLIKMGATIVVVGAAAIYGATTAGYQAGKFITRKILEYRAKKKEESTN